MTVSINRSNSSKHPSRIIFNYYNKIILGSIRLTIIVIIITDTIRRMVAVIYIAAQMKIMQASLSAMQVT